MPRGDVITPHLLGTLATVVAAAGESERAQSLAEEAVAAARPFSLRGILLMALTRAAEAAIQCDDRLRAQVWVRELLGVLHELGARRWVADAVEMAALVRHAGGQAEAAARLLGACGALREASGQSPGCVRLLSGRVRTCRHWLEEALGPDGLAEEEAHGRKMSVEDALSYALTELA